MYKQILPCFPIILLINACFRNTRENGEKRFDLIPWSVYVEVAYLMCGPSDLIVLVSMQLSAQVLFGNFRPFCCKSRAC